MAKSGSTQDSPISIGLYREHIKIFLSGAPWQRSFCLLLLPLWESVIVLFFVVRYLMSILVLQSS